MTPDSTPLHAQTQQLLNGPLKHARAAALAAALIPLASVAATPAWAQSGVCASGGCGAVETANVDATCTGFTIHASGGGLAVGPVYRLDYGFVLTSSSGPDQTVTGSITGIQPDASFNFDVQDARTWADAGVILGGSYVSSGDAQFVADDWLQNAVAITFAPQPLDCPASGAPHLTLTKGPKDGTFAEGQQASFTIAVANDGGSDATNVHLADQLPGNGGLEWVTSTSTQGACAIAPGNALACDLGTIPAGGLVTVTVASPLTTPAAACQLQPNPLARATADGGLQADDWGSLSCTPPPLPCPGGLFTYHVDAQGNLAIVFDQFPAPNDNSYGVNAVGWARGHKFNDLVGSDHAGFQLVDPSGVVRLSFNIDYLTAASGAPSGYASLGPFGGDGKVLVGSLSPADITWTSSLALNLNNVNIPGLFDASSHQQLVGSVNVLVDSPPTDPLHETYTGTDPQLTGWDFHDTYYVWISAAKLASLGFDSTWRVEPNLDALHNSPAKACPVPGGTSALSVTKTEVKDKQVKVTIFNSGAVDEIVNALQLTWPAVNGKLMQVKLGKDVIYDKPDIAPPSASLTLADLVGDQHKRTITHGKSEVLTFVFEKNAASDLTLYTGTVSTSGFTLTVLP